MERVVWMGLWMFYSRETIFRWRHQESNNIGDNVTLVGVLDQVRTFIRFLLPL
jgi:hypothetical protein